MNKLVILFSLLTFTVCLSVWGQTYSIDWSTVDGGGGTSTGSQYTMRGTIGQPDATADDAMSGGNYALTGGFWSIISVVQTAGAPTLYLRQSGSTVTVFWQDVSGWSLVQSGNLTTPIASWADSATPTLTNGTNYLNIVNPTGRQFYRLHKP